MPSSTPWRCIMRMVCEGIMVDCICERLEEMQDENECLRKECENLKAQSFLEKDTLEKFQKDFARFDEKNKALEAENASLKDENSSLLKQIDELDRENTDIQESHMKLYNDSKDEIRKLKEEIQRLNVECDCNETQNENIPEYIRQAKEWGRMFCKGLNDGTETNDRIKKLEDRHQQDCIRFNDMRTAYLVATDELAKLRRQFGVGQ